MAEPADRIPPAQKTYNYHKPAEEPFRAPPVQKTFNYHKPAATPAAAPNRAEAYRLATKAEAERPVLKAPKITYETTGQALSRLRGAADNYAQQNLERDRPSADYVDMPWSEYLPKLARGVLPSALEMGIDAGEMADKAVKDPIGTGKAVLGGLGDLAVGLGSKISDSARSAMGLEVDPFASESKQRALNDLIDSAKGRYGFGEPGEFWKNLADDPASYIADAAAVTTGGLSAAKKVANIADTRQLRRIATPPVAATNLGQMAPEDIAFDDELNRIFGPPTPNDPFPEDIANAAALRDRQDLEDPFDDPDLFTAQYLNDVFPSILERAQRGDPLTDQEAFDVMTFERYGADGVYDPTNTLENWFRQTNAVYGATHTDIEGAERIAFLTGANRNRGQDPVAPVEGPYFADTLGDVYEADDTPDYGYDNPAAYDEELNHFSYASKDPAIPLVQSQEGIASMYSPTRRAVEQLRQSRFPDPVSMEKQLLALGAKPDELESLLKRIGKSDVAEGGIQKLRLAELADEAATEVRQSRRPDREYMAYHLPGAIDPHVTTFEAPVATPKGVSQHFGAQNSKDTVLAHIRSAMFSTPGANRPNVYHLAEMQSDWAQFRAKLLPTADDLSVEASVYNDYLTEFEEARGMGTIYDFDHDMAKMGERIALTRRYGTREEFDKNYPAPYVKTTRKWHQLALKQALIEAVNSDAEYMSLATGEQVKSYTGGKLEGQQMFYDQMTPREFDDILTKFSKEAGVEKPVIEQITIEGEDPGFTWPPAAKHTVPAIRLTDEFKEAMKKYGLPSFAKGGMVNDPESFRAPPVQKTFNYHKPATAGYTQRAPGAMAALAQRTLNVPPKAESFEDFMKRTSDEDKKYLDILFERDKPASDYVDMPLSEFLPRVARNVLPSGAEMAYDVGDAAINAVRHPIDTGKAVLGGLGSLAMGLGSKFDDTFRSAVGLDVDPVESERKQQMLNSLIEAAKGRYGFGEPGEFYKNLADNPASYIMDALALETGGVSAAKKIDELQKLQAEKFLADTVPNIDVSSLSGMQFYRPSPYENYSMMTNPTKAEDLYMDSRDEALRLRGLGTPEQDILDQTGILTIPIKDPMGTHYTDLDIAAMTPQQMIDTRPSRATNYGAKIFEDPDLLTKWYDPRTWGNKNYMGYHKTDPVTGQHIIGLNPNAPAYEKIRTKDHEMGHADFEEAGIGSSIIGGSVEEMRRAKNMYLSDLSDAAKAAATKDERDAILALRKKLASMTPAELYHRIPGEMTARLSEGDPTMAKRLTALQLLNPYMSDNNLAKRGYAALRTALLTETNPAMSKLKAVLEPYGINPKSDFHVSVPTDIEEAIVTGLGMIHVPKY